MTLSFQLLNTNFSLRDYIRALTPDQKLIIDCATDEETRSAQVNAYQVKRTHKRDDGYTYNISMSILDRKITISLIPN